MNHSKDENQGFPNSVKGWGNFSTSGRGAMGNFAGEWNFLPGGGNLRKSAFDHLNLSQS